MKNCGDLTMTSDAQVMATKDMELFSKKAMAIDGSVSAGDDVEIFSCSNIQVSGHIRSGDDVEIFSCSDIIVSSTIEAADRIYLSARDNLTLLSESWLGGMNGEEARVVFLRAGDTMTLDGSISAEKIVVYKKW